MFINNPLCKMCGHEKLLHPFGGHCRAPLRIRHKTNGELGDIITCNCPVMTYNEYRRQMIKMDWPTDRRIGEYIGHLATEAAGGPVPSKTDVIRQAVQEWLKQKGY